MGVKKLKIHAALDLNVGQTYTTKFATKERFTITEIQYKTSGEISSMKGIYENSPHLGPCGLDPGRLNPVLIFHKEIDVCDNPACGHPIDEKFVSL